MKSLIKKILGSTHKAVTKFQYSINKFADKNIITGTLTTFVLLCICGAIFVCVMAFIIYILSILNVYAIWVVIIIVLLVVSYKIAKGNKP